VTWILKTFGTNWKTNLAAVVSFLLSVPSLISAITICAHHQPADWRGAALGIVIALGFAVAKDSTTHSTPAQSQAALAKAVGDPRAPELVKAADKQAEGKTP
jgi:hypothetical protein